MKEIDIEQLIACEQARRRAADAEHMRRLSREVGGDVAHWCSTWRHATRAAAMALLVLLPAGWYMLLPQRTDDRQVLCNIPADKPLVVARACSALGNCGDRQIINMMNMR